MPERLRYVWLRTRNALRMIGKGDLRRLGLVLRHETFDRLRTVPSSAFADTTRPSPHRIRPTALKRQPPPRLNVDRECLVSGIEEIRKSILIVVDSESDIESAPERVDQP